MVRGGVSIRLQRIRREATRRGTTQTRRAVTTTPSGFISRSRFAQIETQEARQQNALNQVINKITSVNNLTQINAILDNAPSIIKSQIEQIRTNVSQQQNDTISRLLSVMNSRKRGQENYRKRRRDADDPDRKERYGIKEDEFKAEVRELDKLISQMRAGSLYSYDSVLSRVNNVGTFERRKEQSKFEGEKAQKKAIEKAKLKTIENIKKAGLNPVISFSGEVLGYKGGADTGFAEYRFDKKGNPEFYKSTRFNPVYSGGRITGYIDNVAKMSIPAPLLEGHIKKINREAKIQSEISREFQGELSKVKLPSGFSFERDKLGNIVSIDDKVRGVNLELGQLPLITKAYLFSPVLREAFKIQPKELFKVTGNKSYVKDLKLYEKFSPKKVIDYTYQRRYNFYKNDFGGKLSYEDFIKEQWKAPNKNFQKTPEGKKIVKALSKSLNDQLKNPEKYGSTARLSALLSVGSGVGLPSSGLILFGSAYFGSIGLAKDVSRNPLPKDFRSIAKVVVKNFGLGALQGLLYGLAFKAGGKVLGKLGKPLLKVTFGAGGRAISKATQLAIQRGFSILGVNYVSRLAGRTTFNIKNIAIGDIELGAGALSKDLGILVGFSIPTVISKMMRNKKIKIQKKIVELEKFRRGSLNSAYLKAKNAQLRDPSRGAFKSSGVVKKLDKNSIKTLSKIASKKGISKAELLDGSYYVQNFRVRSDVPKYEALLKVAKARAKGKPIKIKSVPKFFTFKRYGVVVAKQTKGGTVEAFAIEFNYANGKISNIGFKTAVGANKLTAIKVYKKIRATKGKPVRVKLQDVFLVKNKFETKIPANKNMVTILNRLETKKVFLNNKKLSRKQILNLKLAIKKDLKLSKNPNIEKMLRTLYKEKGVSSKSGFSNVIRIQRVKNYVKIIASSKKAPLKFKIFPKGQYVEMGFTKFRIPSVKTPKVIRFKPTPSKPIKKFKPKIAKKILQPKPIKIKQIKAPTRNLQIQIKSVTKAKVRQVETAVKSIQTIIKPRIRSGKLTKILPISVTKTLIKQIGVLIPLVATKNIQALKNAQSNLRVSATIQAEGIKQINKVQLAQVKALQNVTAQALKGISLIAPITTIAPTKTIRKIRKPTKKPPIGIPKIPKAVGKKKVAKKKKELGYTSALIRNNKRRDLNKIPISKERAFDIVAYSLLKSRVTRGKVSKSSKGVSLSTIKRKVSSIPVKYFIRNRSKFIVRKLKGRSESYEIIKKALVSKNKSSPKRRKVKRTIKKTTRRAKGIIKKRKSVKKKLKSAPKRRKQIRKSPARKKKRKAPVRKKKRRAPVKRKTVKKTKKKGVRKKRK